MRQIVARFFGCDGSRMYVYCIKRKQIYVYIYIYTQYFTCAINDHLVGCDGSRVNVCTVEKGNKSMYRCVFFLCSIIIHQCVYKSNPTGAICAFHLHQPRYVAGGGVLYTCRPRMQKSHCSRTRV